MAYILKSGSIQCLTAEATCGRYGRTRQTILRLIAKGHFPKPHKLDGHVVWADLDLLAHDRFGGGGYASLSAEQRAQFDREQAAVISAVKALKAKPGPVAVPNTAAAALAAIAADWGLEGNSSDEISHYLHEIRLRHGQLCVDMAIQAQNVLKLKDELATYRRAEAEQAAQKQ